MRGHTNSDGDVVLIPSNVCVEEAGSFHSRSCLTPGQDDSYTELSLVPCTIAASASSPDFSRGPPFRLFCPLDICRLGSQQALQSPDSEIYTNILTLQNICFIIISKNKTLTIHCHEKIG